MTFRVQRLPAGVPFRSFRDSAGDPATPVRYNHRRALIARAPFDLDVESEERSDRYASPCSCVIVFRVLEDSEAWLRRNGLWRMGIRAAYVCPCMGTIL